MAMQAQTYSINALANELGKDRRTIARQLQGLPPAETRRVGRRQEKRWRLTDVLKHVDRHRGGKDFGGDTFDARYQELSDLTKKFTTEALFPGVITSKPFESALLGWARSEMHYSKAQALDALCAVSLLLIHAICDTLGDQDLKFHVPPHSLVAKWGNAKRKKRCDSFVAEVWPDKPEKVA
jgi:hypothetical protein